MSISAEDCQSILSPTHGLQVLRLVFLFHDQSDIYQEFYNELKAANWDSVDDTDISIFEIIKTSFVLISGQADVSDDIDTLNKVVLTFIEFQKRLKSRSKRWKSFRSDEMFSLLVRTYPQLPFYHGLIGMYSQGANGQGHGWPNLMERLFRFFKTHNRFLRV